MNVELTFYWIQKWRNFVSFIDAAHLITSISFNSFRKFSGDHENVWEWSDSFLNSHKHIKIVRIKVHKVHGMFIICPKIIHSLLVHSLWEPGKTHTNANHSLSDVTTPKHSDQTFFRAVMLLVFASEYVFPEGGIYVRKISRKKKKENTFSIKKKVRLKKIRQKTRSRSGKKERFKKNDSGQEKRKKTHSRPRK